MSLILDALKKSEAERQRGKAPGLFVEQVVPVRSRRATPGWAYAAGVLLVVVVGVFVWREWSREDVVPAQAQVAAPTALPPLPPAGEGRGEGAPGSSVVPPPVALPPPQHSPVNGGGSPDVARVPAPAPIPAPTALPPLPPAGEGRGEGSPTNTLPRLTDLPAGERNNLPPLKITMHVYADEPAQRFVILDGRRHGEGANPADGLVIREIRRDGLVLSLRGRDVLLPRP